MNPYTKYLLDRLQQCPRHSLLNSDSDNVELFRRTLREMILTEVMGIRGRHPVKGIVLDEVRHRHFRRQSLVIECEPGSWQTAHLYLPLREPSAPMPGIVLASGHGGSKAYGYNPFAAQLYAQLGCAVLLGDPIGEEERNEPYGLGQRGHRTDHAIDRMNEAGRPFLAKVVADMRAGLDYLRQRGDVDANRLGCAGSSMGGTTVQLLVAVEPGIRAAIISAWAADYRALDGMTGCCYRLPGLMRYANQLELMAMAAPECALMVCAGSADEITPPHGLQEMGATLNRWWEQRGAPGRFLCMIEDGGGHRPYHITPAAIRWMAQHLEIESHSMPKLSATRSLGDIYREVGKHIEPLYDQERHHSGTHVPDWPLEFESSESLRILTPERLNRLALTIRDFSLSGYLELHKIARLDQVQPLSEHLKATPQAASQRVAHALDTLAPEPDWLSNPAGKWTQDADGRWSVDLGFIGCRLYAADPGTDTAHCWLNLSRNKPAGDSTNEPMASAQWQATVDLVSFNDNEVLLGEPSIFTNLYLIRRAFALLREHFGPKIKWSIRSEIPRLGELAFCTIEDVHSLLVTAPSAVESSGICNGHAQNIVPNLRRHLEWIDVLLATVPRPVTLPRSYLTPEAASQLTSFRSFSIEG